MQIAILGTRGIPARYGGFETFAEELANRLGERGHGVTVYCRSYLYPDPWSPPKGVSRVLLPAIRSKYLETVSHSLLSFLEILWRRLSGKNVPEVCIVCNGANAPFLWLLKLSGTRTTLNVDGIERERKKWGLAGSLWYRFGELCSRYFADVIVSDAQVIRDYYMSIHGVESEVITYGFNDSDESKVKLKLQGTFPDSDILRYFDLVPGRYILYVSRLEPENHAATVIDAYKLLNRPAYPLVVVGDAPYADSYIYSLREKAGSGVRFLGFQFGESYRELQIGAGIYVQATEVGGTHPALVEAMGFGNCIIANNTQENQEVLGEVGFLYEKNSSEDLAQKLKDVVDNRVPIADFRRLARQRAEELFSWNSITDRYEILCRKLTS